MRLAERGSQAHLTAIASRSTVPEKVTDVLIDRGDREVVHTVTANHGARFSDHGMDRLLDNAHDDVDLRELLVERPDLSSQSVDKLLPLVSEFAADEARRARLRGEGSDSIGHDPGVAPALHRRIAYPQGGHPPGLRRHRGDPPGACDAR